MKNTIRLGVFETNSSSTHSICHVNNYAKEYFRLSPAGYVMVEFGYYLSEECNDVYYTLEDKLSFIFSLISYFIYEDNYRKGIRYKGFTSKKELLDDKNIKAVRELLIKKIPNCKGFKFKRNSFTEDGKSTTWMDDKHLQECNTFDDYLLKNNISLERLILDPSFVIAMNA